MSSMTIAGIGEVLWDVLPEGEVLGGAPVNFAYHVNALGATGIPISTVGTDPRGNNVFRELSEKGIDTSAIATSAHYPTGFVSVRLDDAGSASYHFPDDVAWDYLQINDTAVALSSVLNAVCFGTLAQRSSQTHKAICTYLHHLHPTTLKIYDVNLRQHYYSAEIIQDSLSQADIVKLNDEELTILAALFGREPEEQSFLEFLINDYALSLAVLTKGQAGSVLMAADRVSAYPGKKINVVDTIGAGDAFTAAVAVGYLMGLPMADIHARAHELAAYVCSRRGAMPVIPDHLVMLP